MRKSVQLILASALVVTCETASSVPTRDTVLTHEAMVEWINPAAVAIADVVDDAKSDPDGLDPMLMDDLAWNKIRQAAQSVEFSSWRMARARVLRVGNHTAEVPGFANRAEIQAKLDAHSPAFRRLAERMASDAHELRLAASKHDLRLTRDLADNLNRSCQTCHTWFWEKPMPYTDGSIGPGDRRK